MPFERSPFVYTDMVLALRREASLRSATPVAMGAMRREDFFARALVAISTARALFISAHFNAFDCDESFNYWEPLHFLTFGHGLQTWEHGDAFALRSYSGSGGNQRLTSEQQWSSWDYLPCRAHHVGRRRMLIAVASTSPQ